MFSTCTYSTCRTDRDCHNEMQAQGCKHQINLKICFWNPETVRSGMLLNLHMGPRLEIKKLLLCPDQIQSVLVCFSCSELSHRCHMAWEKSVRSMHLCADGTNTKIGFKKKSWGPVIQWTKTKNNPRNLRNPAELQTTTASYLSLLLEKTKNYIFFLNSMREKTKVCKTDIEELQR